MRRLNGLAALVGLVASVAGMPVVLVAIGASPLPASMPSVSDLAGALSRPDDGTLALSVLAILAWLSWAVLSIAILVEIHAQLRGANAPRLPGMRLPQSVAHGLVGTAALLFLATPLSPSHSLTPSADASPVPGSGQAAVAGTQAAGTALDRNQGTEAPRIEVADHAPTADHTVTPGESLWAIAEQHLGDGRRYPEILELNRELLGDRPGYLQPGVVLRVPKVNSPDPAPVPRYTVRPGDSLSSIAEREFGDQARWHCLYEQNRDVVGADPDLIHPGQVLELNGTASQAPGAKHPDPLPPVEGSPVAPEHRTRHRAEETPATRDQTTGTPATDEQDGGGPTDLSLLRAAAATGFVGAGVFAVIVVNRRRQLRERRPGRTIAASPPELVDVEREVVSSGAPQVVVAEFVEAAIRGLAVQVGAVGTQMPPVGAATLDEEVLRLLFTSPVDVPAPGEWSAAEDGRSWSLPRSAATPPGAGDAAFPYPTLVTVGTTPATTDAPERTWLLDLESLGVVGIAGDPSLVGDAARWLITEMAVNRWSWGVDVVLSSGFAPELNGLTKPDPRGAAIRCVDDVEQATAQAMFTAERSQEAVDYWGKDVLEMRCTGDGEHLSPLVVVVPVDAPRRLVDAATTVDGSRSRVVLIQGDRRADAQIVVNADGTALLTRWGVSVQLHTVSRSVVKAMADLVTATADREDQPMPPAGESTSLTRLTDVAGALRVEYTKPRGSGPGDSVLPESDGLYVEAGATTPEDLQTLAPAVPEEVAAEVLAADPDLDADLVDWADSECRRPRVRLLGPPQVEAWGGETDRLPSVTETVVYLASQDKRSATTQQATAALGIQPATVHNRMSQARAFLGRSAGGEDWLPESSLSPASRKRGIAMYQLHEQVLVDADLFKRLRVRGMSRGRAGLSDLTAALRLVEGEPFSQLPRGYRWLVDNPVHIYLTEGVVDVASKVGNAALAGGDIETARLACKIAIKASPASEDPRLLLAAVEDAAGSGLAAMVLREQVQDVVLADDLIAENPTKRSQAVISSRKWRTAW